MDKFWFLDHHMYMSIGSPATGENDFELADEDLRGEDLVELDSSFMAAVESLQGLPPPTLQAITFDPDEDPTRRDAAEYLLMREREASDVVEGMNRRDGVITPAMQQEAAALEREIEAQVRKFSRLRREQLFAILHQEQPNSVRRRAAARTLEQKGYL